MQTQPGSGAISIDLAYLCWIQASSIALDHVVGMVKNWKLIIPYSDRSLCEGVAIYYSDILYGAPPALEAQVSRFPALHEVNVFATIRFVPVPEVLEDERLLIKQLPIAGFYHVIARWGSACGFPQCIKAGFLWGEKSAKFTHEYLSCDFYLYSPKSKMVMHVFHVCLRHPNQQVLRMDRFGNICWRGNSNSKAYSGRCVSLQVRLFSGRQAGWALCWHSASKDFTLAIFWAAPIYPQLSSVTAHFRQSATSCCWYAWLGTLCGLIIDTSLMHPSCNSNLAGHWNSWRYNESSMNNTFQMQGEGRRNWCAALLKDGY